MRPSQAWQAEIAVGAVQEEVGILPPKAISELLTKISAEACRRSRQLEPRHPRLATPQPHLALPFPPPETVREGIARARAFDKTGGE